MYKLVDQKLQTRNGFQWTVGKWEAIAPEKRGGGLCSQSWFYCYNSPLLAVLLNPIHAAISNPRLFICETRGIDADTDSLKFGFTEMWLTEEIPVPEVSTVQRVAFAILSARTIYKDPAWNVWAENWLSGRDRTADSAQAAVDTVGTAAGAATEAEAAAGMATWAALSADRAAEEAAAGVATWAAVDADRAAEEAAWAAKEASLAEVVIDFCCMAEEAMKY